MKNIYIIYFLVSISCNDFTTDSSTEKSNDSGKSIIPGKLIDNNKKVIQDSVRSTGDVEIKNAVTINRIIAEQLLTYAKTLIGTPYKYASTNPAAGFDCSGFITHVFNHFAIEVPRSSVDFTNYGITINLADAKPGDLILFTGTDSTSTVVGHMGIITGNTNGEINFIHSTSGKAYGVTISALNKYYQKRFVKVIRVPFYTGKLL